MPPHARPAPSALTFVVALVVSVGGFVATDLDRTAPRVALGDFSVGSQTSGISSSSIGDNPWFATYDSQNGYVYVVNSGAYAGSHNTSVTVIDGLRTIASLNVGDYPWFATFDSQNGFLYVENTNSSFVTVIQGTQFIANVPVGQDPVDGAYDPANGMVYIPNLGSNNVSVLSGTHPIGGVNVPSKPWSATYDPGDGYVYVVGVGSSLVSVINGTTLIGSIDVGGVPGYESYAAYDGGNGFMYLSNEGTQSVDVIQGTNLVASIPVGGTPTFPTYDPRNGYIYVGNLGPPCTGPVACIPKTVANVTVISGTQVVQNVQVGAGPFFSLYDPGNGYVYVSSYFGSVSVISGTRSVSTLPLGGSPYFSAYDPSNGYVYVVNPDINGVDVLSGVSLVGTLVGPNSTINSPASGSTNLAEVILLGVGGVVAVVAIAWWLRKTDRPPRP